MKKNNQIKKVSILAVAFAVSAFAQSAPYVKNSDSLAVPINVENYNEFQIDKWGPVTYEGEGRCSILNLYQRSMSEGLGYSSVVDYHSKETKSNNKYTCESWGLGLSFKVVPDPNKNSENYGLRANSKSPFSAKSKNSILKFFESDTSYFEVESVTPVTYQTEGKCYVIDFLIGQANEETGFHGIIDIKAAESQINDTELCTFWGLAVKYKRREVIEKTTVQKRVVEVIEVPAPKPDTVYIPSNVPNKQSKPSKNCCCSCCCD